MYTGVTFLSIGRGRKIFSAVLEGEPKFLHKSERAEKSITTPMSITNQMKSLGHFYKGKKERERLGGRPSGVRAFFRHGGHNHQH